MMKNKIVILSGIIILLVVVIASACKKEEEEPEEGDIKITCVPLAGETVDVSNLTVELHKKATFELSYKTAKASGSASSSSVSFSSVPNGTYYAFAWEDLDNSGDPTIGDTYGFCETPIKVDGKSVSKTIMMYEEKN
ncbi:MAG: hypothetical protein K9J13_10405 [Saprospiraceae bacterium]|nr:hypothetical protein [Saprospiraceae bacterium]